MATQERTRKTADGVVSGEVKEPRRVPAVARPKAMKHPKGRKLAPSRMPRREEATDRSIGKGEEEVRLRSRS
ncbi:hypothetical protein D0B54_01090 [Solimonas sp. K1W22B-7]|uniref:hypothetical protein n=1 Tax=Solimonas sp. K1W22B-7 TaxID=2303331 RepID=UPI000E337C15|nr:hypothetical protein [Solimonas sp. K1W22B-7]AXQ27367.1 hypothetical protein D0B54_01090 [Solimonas sp. K1W22B-7]